MTGLRMMARALLVVAGAAGGASLALVVSGDVSAPMLAIPVVGWVALLVSVELTRREARRG